MEYPDDAFHTFMDLDNAIYNAVNGTVTSLIQNILNCVLKTNKDFTGLERHGGKVINDKIFILGWSNPLSLWETLYYTLLLKFGFSMIFFYV